MDYRLDTDHVGRFDRANAALYAHARPWVIDFLDTVLKTVNLGLNAEHQFRITSLVRTKAYQRRLRRGSRWAASGRAAHYRQSPHLTGATVDISLKDMPPAARELLFRDLKRLSRDGAIDFLHERSNKCVHVFVKPDWRKKSPLYPDVGC